MATKILITGTAGFVGNALALRLLERGDEVVGIDNLSDYYDVKLKQDRLARLEGYDGFVDVRAGLEDKPAVDQAFKEYRPDVVINLAAQAGVRHSVKAPQAYIDSNITGFLNVLETIQEYGCGQLIYASSSSVYGANSSVPFAPDDPVDHPLSMYAVTKRTNELMAHVFGNLYGIKSIGLRFFTVYGPWGRPDMALYRFTKAILANQAIDIYNNGQLSRDFTYIDDVVTGLVKVVDRGPSHISSVPPEQSGPASSASAPFQLYNIGNSHPVELMDYVKVLEDKLGKKAIVNYLPMQPGDVPATWADVQTLSEEFGYVPATSVEQGVSEYVAWYLDYYGASSET